MILQASNGQWHEMNDNTVTLVSPQHVLKQQAYILFYSKEQNDTSIGVIKKDLPDEILKSGARGFQRDASSSSSGSGSSSSSSRSSSYSGGGGGGSNGSNIDDEGEMLSPAEVAQVQCTQQARTQTHIALKTDAARSSSSLPPFAFKTETETETEEDNEDLLLNGDGDGDGEGEGEDSVGCEIRLKKKCSWAVKPFRYSTVHTHCTHVRTFMPISVCVSLQVSVEVLHRIADL